MYNYWNKLVMLLFLVLVFFSIEYGNMALADNWETVSKLFDVEDLGRDLLAIGIPGLTEYETHDSSLELESPLDLIELAMETFDKVNLADPKIILSSQMGYLQLIAQGNTPLTQEEIIYFERDYTFDEMIPDQKEDPNHNDQTIERVVQVVGEPLVAIYNSHNGETYTPDDGVPRIDGVNGGIARVAETLAKSLEEQGIITVRSEKIHDYPSYTLAYANSLKTVEEMLLKYPSIEIVIDVSP